MFYLPVALRFLPVPCCRIVLCSCSVAHLRRLVLAMVGGVYRVYMVSVSSGACL